MNFKVILVLLLLSGCFIPGCAGGELHITNSTNFTENTSSLPLVAGNVFLGQNLTSKINNTVVDTANESGTGDDKYQAGSI